MPIQIINCTQGEPEWFSARAGIPTASEFDTVMAHGKGGAPSKTRRTYMLKLLGERITGQVIEGYSNAHMERGKAMEAEARAAYALMADVEPELVGFIRNGNVGCSPDSLIGDNGINEIKSKLPHLQLELLFTGEMPSEHVAQVQGQLWVAEREWCDFVSYWPGIRIFVKRVYRDEKYIANLSIEVRMFLEELSALENKYRQAA